MTTRGRARVSVVLAYLLFLLVLVEGGARAFWHFRFRMSFFDTRGDATMFYPDLRLALSQKPSRRDSIIDVLLLGGSALNREYGAIAPALRERLAVATGRPVRVYNLGVPAHTSLDSYFKYRALAAVQFDIVINYDGFNEVRFNAAPPDRFRDDYSHVAFYERANDILNRRRTWPLAVPYTVTYFARQFASWRAVRAGHPIYTPKQEPDSAWIGYGKDIRTADSFRRNITSILAMAAERGEPVVLMTYAAYFAPEYSRSAFTARRLDYATHLFPTELWGLPENVATGLTAHNDVIRGLHAAWPATGFIDMDNALPRGQENFNDVCHLTVAGSERFVDLMMPVVLAKLGIIAP